MTATFTNLAFSSQDEFTTSQSAGAVDATLSEPGGQMRKVIDTEGKISIVGGKLTFASGKTVAAYGDPGFWLQSVPRSSGLLLLAQINVQTLASKILMFGFDSDQAGATDAAAIQINGTVGINIIAGSTSAYNGVLPPIAANTDYVFCIAMRPAAGAQFFWKNGAYFLLEYITSAGAQLALYPYLTAFSATFTSDYVRTAGAFLAPPLISDGFSGALGTTDGLAQAEITGLGSGGGGVAWTQRIGTWQTSGGKANASALSGGLAIATVTPSTTDVLIKVKLTRVGGSGGIVVRYVDASNYIYLVHDGTNLNLIKRVAGVETTVKQTAIAYGAGAELVIVLTATKFRGVYSNTPLANGVEYTIADAALQANAQVGLYTTDTGNQFDDFLVYARGTNNEYAALANVGTLAGIGSLSPTGGLTKRLFRGFTATLAPIAVGSKMLVKTFAGTLAASASFAGMMLPFLRRIVSFLGWDRTTTNEAGLITQTERDFSFYAGDTVSIDGQVRNYAGSGVNITGCTFRWNLSKGGVVYLSKSTNDGGITLVDRLNGVYRVKLLNTETGQLISGQYTHECEMTDLAGNVTTVMAGSVLVMPSQV